MTGTRHRRCMSGVKTALFSSPSNLVLVWPTSAKESFGAGFIVFGTEAAPSLCLAGHCHGAVFSLRALAPR